MRPENPDGSASGNIGGMGMSEKLQFIKMEGAGNDYVYVDCFNQYVLNPQAFSRRVSDRHFGIGSDGVILIRPSKRADCFMDIYNADGSRGRTCGNGLRCTAMYLWEKCKETHEEFQIETLSGISRAKVWRLTGKKCWVSVTMGRAFCRETMISFSDVGRLLPEGVFVDRMQLVDTGNLHCVIMLKNCRKDSLPEAIIEKIDMKAIGTFFENTPEFPLGINVEVCMNTENTPWVVRARVWERGSGETMACGSGACAIYRTIKKWHGPAAPVPSVPEAMEALLARPGGPAAALLSNSSGPAAAGAGCCIFMPGGRLSVWETDGELMLGGEAVRVFEGCI